MHTDIHFVTTDDGSRTLFHPGIGEHYHSRHGALQESKHVFLGMGLMHALAAGALSKIAVLEVGFGTGLNFLVTADYCQKHRVSLDYVGIEAYPLSNEFIKETGYQDFVSPELWDAFLDKYPSCLSGANQVIANAKLEIAHAKVLGFDTGSLFDVIYFDAFAAIHQPEMWTEEVLARVARFLRSGGVFVTYAITGELKRTMKALGFEIEKAPGAPGKREMLRAIKP